jgi:hypothetical protein
MTFRLGSTRLGSFATQLLRRRLVLLLLLLLLPGPVKMFYYKIDSLFDFFSSTETLVL